MPNWCFNHMEVFGGDEDGNERARFFSKEEFDVTTPLQKYLPMSEYHQTMEGFNDGGYGWCLDNWGVKWPEKNIYNLSDDRSLIFSFDTPWGPPIAGYVRISQMFPELFFIHYFQEEGMQFAGVIIYQNGSQVYSSEVGSESWPEWDDSYEVNHDEWVDKLQEMMDNFMSGAHRALKYLTHIE